MPHAIYIKRENKASELQKGKADDKNQSSTHFIIVFGFTNMQN